MNYQKNKLIYFTCFIYFISLSNLCAQTLPSLDFAHGTGGSLSEEGRSITTDSKGNICIIGNYSGLADFDHRLISSRAFNSNGNLDVFVAKYDETGNILWVRSIGGSRSDLGYAIAVDPNDNILVTGGFRESGIDFNRDSIPSVLLNSSGSFDIFITKFSPNGVLKFAFNLGGSASDIGKSIKSDASGNIIVIGEQESDTIDYDPGNGIANRGNKGGTSCFIAKYDSSGNFIWAGTITGIVNNSTIIGNDLETDRFNDLYVTGRFIGSDVDFDFSPNGSAIYNTGPSNSIFLFKYDSNGQYQWAFEYGHPIGGSGDGIGNDLAIDRFDKLIITGQFRGTIDFDPTTPAPQGNLVNSSTTTHDVFIAKYNTNNGQHLWSRAVGGTLEDIGYGVGTDNNGNIYVHGEFNSTSLDLDPGPNGTGHILQGAFDIFLGQYDSIGNHIRSLTIGGSDNDYARGLTIDNTQSILITGSFRSPTIDFNPNLSASYILTSKGFDDIYIARFSDTCFIADTITVSACQMYRSPSGNIYTSSGTYSDTIPNSVGCDSLFTVNLNLTKIDTSIIQRGDTLISSDTSGTYQWFSCTTGLIIQGATDRFFIVPTNGIYACVVSKNGCTETSACIIVNNIGIDMEIVTNLQFYPNPTSGDLFINLGKTYAKGEIQVFNSAGVICHRADLINDQHVKLSLEKLAPGLHFLQIDLDGYQPQYFKLIKE